MAPNILPEHALAIYHSIRRLIASENGICQICLKRPFEHGKKACGACLRDQKVRGKAWRTLTAADRKLANASYVLRIKRKCFEGYGGARCSCCSETEIIFLTIDHIDGCGAAKRKIDRGGYTLYLRLIKRGFPKGYRVLCYNCNCGRRCNGGICPHEKIKVEAQALKGPQVSDAALSSCEAQTQA